MIRLRYETTPAWLEAVEADLIGFLQDHAANERRVARSALTLGVQYPERVELVDAMVDVAMEEMEHFKLVYDILRARDATLGTDMPDQYMRRLHREFRDSDRDEWLLRRLVLFGVVEARGYERFAILADGLADRELRTHYSELARSEARHHALYLRLAGSLFPADRVEPLLERVLDAEASAMADQTVRATLH